MSDAQRIGAPALPGGGSRSAATHARRSSGRARAALRERLEARREEIEQAALTRVRAISDPSEVSDPAYAEGLRAAVCAAIDYGIETTGREGADPPIPVALLAQARMAARVAVPLDTVLRRYFAGYSLLGYFILEEAAHAGLTDGAELKRLLGAHAGIFDRLLAAVGEEHGRESEVLTSSSRDSRQAEQIERLLAGEPIDPADVPYDLDGWHLGMVLVGPAEVARPLRELAARLDSRPLLLPRAEGYLWVWLGARQRLSPLEVGKALSGHVPTGCSCALGEPGEGLPGWRLTHQQAAAVLPVATRAGKPLVRYADVALLASVSTDDLLVGSLQELFLGPLAEERDGGRAAKETLRAYFAAGRSVSAAAVSLAVKRHTVTRRLRAVEQRIGRPLESCAAEIEMALRLESLGVPIPANEA